MAITMNKIKRSSGASDPGKTSDLSAARDAAAARPTRRSARGSEVVAREKKERREARGRGSKAAARVSSTATRQGGGAAARGAARRATGGAKGAGGRTRRDAMRYATDNRLVSWVYDFTTGPKRYVFYLLVALFVGMGVYWPVRDFYIAHRTEAILREQKAIRKRYNDALGQEVEGLLSQEGVEDAARRDYGMVMPGEKTITVEGLNEDGEPVVVDRSDPDAAAEGAPGDGGEGSGRQGSTSTNGAASKNDEGKLKAEDAADKSKTGSDAAAPDPDKVPMTSAEVEAAERAVLENSEWYWKVLDSLFFFNGANGMAVVSTGE